MANFLKRFLPKLWHENRGNSNAVAIEKISGHFSKHFEVRKFFESLLKMISANFDQLTRKFLNLCRAMLRHRRMSSDLGQILVARPYFGRNLVTRQKQAGATFCLLDKSHERYQNTSSATSHDQFFFVGCKIVRINFSRFY